VRDFGTKVLKTTCSLSITLQLVFSVKVFQKSRYAFPFHPGASPRRRRRGGEDDGETINKSSVFGKRKNIHKYLFQRNQTEWRKKLKLGQMQNGT